MFKFLNKNKEKDSDDKIFIKTAALLIHAAKIDQSYQLEEKNIIKKTIISLGVSEENSDSLISKAEKYENDDCSGTSSASINLNEQFHYNFN